MPLSSYSSKDTNAKVRCEKNFYSDKSKVDFLADLIEEGSQNPTIYEFTRKLLNHKKVESYDNIGEIKACFYWVRDNIAYRNHVMCRDSFQTAERTFDMRAGDCDQATVLLNSMLLSVGIPTGMRIISTSHDKPFHHIYSLAGNPKNDPEQWIPLDTINKQQPMGWEPPYAKKIDFMVVCS